MNANRTLRTTVLLLSAAVIALSAAPTFARDDDGRRGRDQASARRDRDDHRDRDDYRGRNDRSRRNDRYAPRGGSTGSSITIGRGNVGVQVRIGQASQRRWVSGYYATRYEQVCVQPGRYEIQTVRVLVEAGHYETRYVPAETTLVYDRYGRGREVVTRPARHERVWVPARYETRQVRVWVEARYETRAVQVWVPGHWQ